MLFLVFVEYVKIKRIAWLIIAAIDFKLPIDSFEDIIEQFQVWKQSKIQTTH